RRRRRNRDARRAHGFDLVGGGAFAAGDDRARMAHTPSRRSGHAGDETNHRLLAPALGFQFQEIGRRFFRRAADLADHDHRLRLGIAEEQLEDIDDLGAFDRIAADPDASRLPEARHRRLVHGFVGERARSRNDADAAALMDVARHDADLALAWRNDAG